MLVLGRKEGQSILIAGGIRVTILKTTGRVIRVGIEAPPEVSIRRSELDDGAEKRSTSVLHQDADLGAMI